LAGAVYDYTQSYIVAFMIGLAVMIITVWLLPLQHPPKEKGVGDNALEASAS
jgi:hypothetical protein